MRLDGDRGRTRAERSHDTAELPANLASCEVRAVRRYDPERSDDLLTYAVPTIRGDELGITQMQVSRLIGASSSGCARSSTSKRSRSPGPDQSTRARA